MARYTIQVPNGKKLTIEADSEQAAMTGAQQWFEEQTRTPPPGYGGASVDQSDPRPLWDVPGDISRAFQGSVDALKSDAAKGFTSGHTGPTGEGMLGVLKRTGQDVLALPEKFIAGAKVPLDALGAASAPVTGALNATAGSAMSYLPGMNKEKADEALGLALSAARPGKPIAPKAKAPTIAELGAEESRLYDLGRNQPMEINPQSTNALADQITADLHQRGFRDKLQPATFSAVDELRKNVGPTATISDIESPRRVLTNAATDFKERAAAKLARDKIDAYLENVPAQDVLAGDPKAVSDIFKQARATTAAKKRAELVEKALKDAGIQSGSTFSGLNVDNPIRQKLASIARNEKKTIGWTDDEIAQLDRAIKGTRTGNALRTGGNLLAGGGGVGGTLLGGGGAYLTGNPLLLGVPVVGAGMRLGGAMSTRRQANNLSEMLRMRSPLGQSRQLPVVAPSPGRAGLLGGASLGNQMPDARYMGLLGEMGLLPYPAQ